MEVLEVLAPAGLREADREARRGLASRPARASAAALQDLDFRAGFPAAARKAARA